MSKKHMIEAAISALFILLLIVLFVIKPFGSSHTADGFYFDTVTRITIYDKMTDSRASSVIGNINEMLSRYDCLFSRTRQDSEIYAINHSNGKEVSISKDTGELLQYALNIAEFSDGLVDPTIGALTSLWNIGSSNTDTIPSDEAIKEALKTVDYHNVVLNPTDKGYTVRLLNPDSMIDLGFIAKGYIADRIKEYLISQNVRSAIINLGGNVLTLGSKPDGEPFTIGIKDPDNTSATIHTVTVSDCSVVSSGDYERYMEIEGIRYHHILSTRTGYPAESDIHQVTVISDNSIEGDALSTLCFILGKEKAANFIAANYPDIKIIF